MLSKHVSKQSFDSSKLSKADKIGQPVLKKKRPVKIAMAPVESPKGRDKKSSLNYQSPTIQNISLPE